MVCSCKSEHARRASNHSPQVKAGKELGNLPRGGGAESGAARSCTDSQRDTTDPDLAKLIAIWPSLPEPVRKAILNLAASAT